MKDHYDPWYVRLPDGRTIKAKSTTSVRHHIEAGHVPLSSTVRRDSTEEWVNLVWVAEFADFGASLRATPPTPSATGLQPSGRSGVSARLDPMRLQTVGVRGLIDELIAALDSTLSRSKIVPAFLASILIYLGLFAARTVHQLVLDPTDVPWLPVVAGAGFAVIVLSILNAVLAKLTHLELSTMRPAKLREGLKGFTKHTIPALIANSVVAGSCLGLLLLMRKLPQWTTHALSSVEMNPNTQEILTMPILVIIYIASALLWIIVGLCWLLTPAIVVEESSWLGGIREWRQLIKEHFGRVVVYEGLAVMLGIAVALPLTLAVGLALEGNLSVLPVSPVGLGDGTNLVTGTLQSALHGLTAAPLLALLAVANVFIYLNLRYEQTPNR
ncbi:MAG: hypothetical protein EXS09_12710 [Gemmataceae bacterium]|nr:hypothetical protein [Gemmataceae bacterium]